MATFDFIGAASAGYKFAWDKRSMVARYALPLFLVKFASFVIITSFDLDLTLLRQGLVLLPSYFIEGWVLAVLIRFYMKAEPEEDNAARSILACVLLYVLVKLFLAVTGGLAFASQPVVTEGADMPPPTLGSFVAAMIALGVTIWAFRLLWFYIPAAIGYPLQRFAERISSYITSIYMIGTWLICVLPPLMVLILFTQILLMEAPKDSSGTLLHFILVAAQAVVEIVTAVISTIAMTEAIRSILFDKRQKDLF